MFTIEQIREIYSRTAGRYDRLVRIFPVFGLRMQYYRREAVAALQLEPGSTVVELGCGTGLNFGLLEAAVGPGGRIIGIDLTPQMLDQARQRARHQGWSNIELAQGDIAEYVIPQGVNGILSTFALTLSPRFDEIVERARAVLAPGDRLVILDLKRPARWPEWLVRFVAWLNRPFAVTTDLAERHPWESVRRHLHEVDFREYYLGALYQSVGERPGLS